ncbi:cytochrome c nitrite reductase small subunit [Rapidithrix thailandica]|uniref:Cytochrome c nitrite reductase small subunit n=1 Tax=Rapidithrix thailandica TaxID=413964 RepID=A0AAW9SDD1_9BACT
MFKFLIPPPKWQVPVIILLGAILGLGIYMIRLSEAYSYLSDDPRACINCHVMTPQYITYKHSSHREVASCNDCHVPHDHIANTYYFKAKDGLYHASVFTLRMEPQTIKMRPPSVAVVQDNCIRCHTDQVTDAQTASWVADHINSRTNRLCWECHREVPHGRVRSLSAIGYHIEPLKSQEEKELIVPEWIKKEMEKDKTQKTSDQ